MKEQLVSLLQKRIVLYTLIAVPIISIVVFLIGILALDIQLSSQIDKYSVTGQKSLELSTIVFEESYNNIVNDVGLIEQLIELELRNQGSESANLNNFSLGEKRQFLEDYFRLFVENNRLVIQLRLIDVNGDEIIRVDRIGDEVISIEKEKLQNKADRYYFTESIDRECTEVYTSRIDLNIENGEIELPYKPVLRVAKQINNHNGDILGVVVINDYVGEIFDRIEEISLNDYKDIEILDAEGYWLKSKRVDHEWAFMYEERKNTTILIEAPEIWTEVTKDSSGQWVTDNELVAYRHYTLGDNTYIFLYRKDLNEIRTETALQRSTVKGALFFLGVILLITYIILIHTREARRNYNRKLQKIAMYDTLTNIPNRLNFNQAMDDFIAKDNGRFAVLFMDLDGFKKINDTYGHDIGDKLLISVSNRIKRRLRSDDYVYRIGGDEFTVIATKIKEAKNAERIAEKIIESVSEPYQFEMIRCEIGISIGIAVYPDDGTNANQLVTLADDLMYAVKESGKNNYMSINNKELED